MSVMSGKLTLARAVSHRSETFASPNSLETKLTVNLVD